MVLIKVFKGHNNICIVIENAKTKTINKNNMLMNFKIVFVFMRP